MPPVTAVEPEKHHERILPAPQARIGMIIPSVNTYSEPQFNHFAPDGLVYVCERGSDRIQAFTKQGKFVNSFFVHPTTPSRGTECGGPGGTTYGMSGTTYNLTFSHDPNGQYVMIADGTNDKIWIHDRFTGELAGSIGGNGRTSKSISRFARRSFSGLNLNPGKQSRSDEEQRHREYG